MFLAPMSIPSVTHDTDTMITTGQFAVLFTTFFTKHTTGTYVTTAAAYFSAAFTDISTLFTSVASFTDYAAITAMINAVHTDRCTILAQSTVAANRTTLTAGSSAIRADIGISFTVMAISAQWNAAITHFTIRTMCICTIRTLSAAFTITFCFTVTLTAVWAMFPIVHCTICAQITVVAPFIKTVAASAAIRADMLRSGITRFTFLTMFSVTNCTIHTHLAVIAPFTHTFGTITTAETLIRVI